MENFQITPNEFLNIFKVILDITTIREKSHPKNGKVDIKGSDLEEFKTFIKVYIHLLSTGVDNQEYKDIFSIGISSLRERHVKEIVRELESVLKESYELLNKEEKVDRLVSILSFVKGVDVNDIESRINFEEITKIIQSVKYEGDEMKLKGDIGKYL